MTTETRKNTKIRRGKHGLLGRKATAPSRGRAKAPASDPKRGRDNAKANPQTNFKRYMELAREAASSGDAVQSEYYYQYADHYHRVMEGN